jgi:glycosyltransferase involved in cell wall biosynthesis
MSLPQVSIVTPVFNGERYLAETVEAVLAQTFTDWELLLIDDGSTDRSPAIARQYAAVDPGRIRYLEHPGHANRGQFATRAFGASQARAEVIALLDQDDLWDRDYLENHLRLWDAAQQEGVRLSYGPSLYWHGPSANGARDFVQPMPPGTPRVFTPGELLGPFYATRYVNTPCPSCALLGREVFHNLERYGQLARNSPAEDQFLWWHVAARWPVAVHDHVWVRYRQHPASAFVQAHAVPGNACRSELAFLRAIREDLIAVCPGHPLLAKGTLDAGIRALAWSGLWRRLAGGVRKITPEPARRLARRLRRGFRAAGPKES